MPRESPDARDAGRVRLGVSACLLGQPVRFDGGHKRDAFLTAALDAFVEWVPVCPEQEAGFGTPRESMRLVQIDGAVRLLTVRTRRDVTEQLGVAATRRAAEMTTLDLDGFVLKKDSPSCGLRRVKVYEENGPGTRSGMGLFAQALCAADPLLPVEEEGRLQDPAIREHFVERVFAHRRWRQLVAGAPRARDLVSFHTAHKLLLLAHSPAAYVQLGRMVAGAGSARLAHVVTAYGRAFMTALASAATRGRHVNVLQHAAGYLRGALTADARRDVASTIADYEHGLVPLVVPLRLLAHHVKVHGIAYLSGQAYLDPHPKALMLRNAV
jgi:uncharacterized protein YbgA (DUF1722 family)/uncharacterized protein YbbK (DUF523 family)